MSVDFFRRLLNFVQYHNAFAIAFVMVFVGVSVSFASSPTLRENVYTSQQSVVSIDNHRIISVDLKNFNLGLKIESITEDEINYYVIYSFKTIAVKDEVWQDVLKKETLTVNKTGLANNDLGLYVAKQLADNINYQANYLKQVQAQEKKRGLAQKVVSIKYAGLIGKLLDPKEKVFSGYTPVVIAPASELAAVIAVPPMREALPVIDEWGVSGFGGLINENRIRQIVKEMLEKNLATSTSATSTTATTTIFTTDDVVIISPIVETTTTLSETTTPTTTPTILPEAPTPTTTPTVEPPIELPTEPSTEPVADAPTESI